MRVADLEFVAVRGFEEVVAWRVGRLRVRRKHRFFIGFREGDCLNGFGVVLID